MAELYVIAAAVIGGTSLAGGIGTIPGAVVGALIIQSLDNGMVLLDVSSAKRQIFIGLVLIARGVVRRRSTREGDRDDDAPLVEIRSAAASTSAASMPSIA